MRDCAYETPPNGQRASRQGVRQGKVPGARASPMGMAHALAKRPEMGFRPGETSRNRWLPVGNAKRCVIARTEHLRTGKGPRARAFARAKGLAPGRRPWAWRTPWPNAPKRDFAQAKCLTARTKCLPPCDSRQNPIPGALRLKSQKGGAPRTTLPPRLDGPSRLLQYYRGVHGCFSFIVGCKVA